MRYLLVGAALVAMTGLIACQEAEQPQSAATDTVTPSPVLIIDVVPTPAQQAGLDQRLSTAKAVEPFKDPAGYKAAHQAALDYALTVYADPHPKLEDIKLEIAFGDFLLGNAQTALKALESSLPVYIAAGDDYREKRIEINNNLGVAYTQLGEPQKSITFLNRAIAEWRVKYEDQPNIDLATALDNLAMAYNRVGDHALALTTNLEALSMAESLSPDEAERRNDQIVVAMGNRSKYLAEASRLKESVANSLALVSRLDGLLGPDNPRGAYILSSLSTSLRQMRHYKSAETNARRAVDLRERHYGREEAETAIARNGLVSALLAQSKFAQALPLAEFNYAVLNEGRGPLAEQTLAAQQNLSRALFGLNRTNEALAIQKQNVDALSTEDLEKNHDRDNAVDVYADMLILTGQFKAVDTLLAEIENKSELGLDNPNYHALVMTRDLADAHLNPERPASPSVRDSERWLDTRRTNELFSAGTSGARDLTLRNSYGRAVAAAFQRDDAVAAFRLLQKYDTDAITAARYKQLMRTQLTRKQDQKDLTRLQDLYEDHTAALHQTFLATSAGDLGRVATLSKRIAALDIEIGSLTETLKPALVEHRTSGIIALDDITPTLGDTDALITIASTPYGLHVALVTSEGIHLQTHDMTAAQRVIISTADVLKNQSTLTTDMAPFDALGQLIFNEDLLMHLKGRENLSVISRGAMAQIPLSVARIKVGQTDAENSQWAVERFAFNHLTSLSDLLATSSSKARSIDHFIGVGFSQFPPEPSPLTESLQAGSMDYSYRSAGDLQRLKDLPRLPGAGAELRAISQNFSPETSDILADRIFSEKDVRALDLSNATVLSFASHGLMPGELESVDEAALVIAPSSASTQSDNDGLLTASEIFDLKLSAEWVVLSACNSGAGNAETGEALSGLATAFTYAGAKSLLVSHWPVRDDAAAFLTINTVKNYQSGMSKAKALQKAMNDLRTHTEIPDAANPAIWAPFVLIGQ